MSGSGQRDGEREESRRSGGRYIGFVGLAFLVVIAFATLNTVQTTGGGILGISAEIRGQALPEFALPNVRGPLVGDANVYQDDCESSQRPCPAASRRTPACRIDVRGAIRVCDLFDRPLAISFWFTRGASCLPAQDAFDAVARRYRGRVNFLSIDVRDDRDTVRGAISDRGWTVPVGWDRDGAVSDLYRVGGCPTVAFAFPGGVFAGARASDAELTRSKLTAAIRSLIDRSRRREAG